VMLKHVPYEYEVMVSYRCERLKAFAAVYLRPSYFWDIVQCR
jgi:hypothetical protein